MQIYVRCCDGKILSLDVDPQDTIGSVKEQIQECQGIPPDEQRLLYQGKLLPEEGKSTLSDHWVGKEESFHLFGPGEPTEKQEEDGGARAEAEEDKRSENLAALPPLPVTAPTQRICVKGLVGRAEILEVHPTDSIMDVKVRYAHALMGQYRPQQMRLIHAGNLLEDGMTVADHNPEADETWHLVIRC